MAPPRITTNSLPFPSRLINPTRLRSYLLRLPLFTRLILLAIIVFWLLEFQTVWNVVQWGSLDPKEIGFGSMYRLNTFPLIHVGFWHMLMDTICLVPLLERFEAEMGTLTSVALFMGRKFPASHMEKETDRLWTGDRGTGLGRVKLIRRAQLWAKSRRACTFYSTLLFCGTIPRYSAQGMREIGSPPGTAQDAKTDDGV